MGSADLKLGLAIHWTDESFDETLGLIRAGEELGYDHLWIANDKFYHDMYVTAAVAAQNTVRPTIGTFVSDPYSMHPALTAMAVGTLDEISGGRAMICLGAGGTGFREMGIERVRPARALRETIELLRRLFSGQHTDYAGEVVRFESGKLGLETRADIPIIVGTRGELVLKMAGEMADGVLIATYAEPTGIRHALERITIGARAAGRALSDLYLISRIDTCVHANRETAYDAVREPIAVALWSSFPDRRFVDVVDLEVPDDLENIIAERDYDLLKRNTHLVPDEFVEKFAWAGTAEDVARQVAAVVAEGIASLTIMPIAGAGQSRLDVVRRFARDVAPAVGEMLTEG